MAEKYGKGDRKRVGRPGKTVDLGNPVSSREITDNRLLISHFIFHLMLCTFLVC